ncbi:MAG: hypothetical protein FJX57_11115 [Alphaproteobacteria bacterium]|nr:hypothetical protein [Alphaproteobacteria bacterium]
MLEEPLPPEDVDGLAQLRQNTRVQLAAGERILTKCGFRPPSERRLIESGDGARRKPGSVPVGPTQDTLARRNHPFGDDADRLHGAPRGRVNPSPPTCPARGAHSTLESIFGAD